MSTARLKPKGTLSDGFDVHGFPFTTELQKDLAAMSLDGTRIAATRTLLIESTERPASRALEATVNGLKRETIPGLEDWHAILKRSSVTLPPEQIRRIFHFLVEP